MTLKPFTSHTPLVAIRTSGNVFAKDTVDRLNIKANFWRDLVTDEPFTRKDIITIQVRGKLRVLRIDGNAPESQ